MVEAVPGPVPGPSGAAAVKSNVLPIVASALIGALVMGGGVYAWQSQKARALETEATEARLAAQKAEAEAAALKADAEGAPEPMPFFYTKGIFPSTELHAVDPLTRTYEVIYKKELSFRLYAVPRLGYDGRIFLDRLFEGDDPTAYPLVFDVNTRKDPVPVSFTADLPFVGEAQAVSPDETRLAAAYDNPSNDPKDSPRNPSSSGTC